jgi:hypothetical protein
MEKVSLPRVTSTSGAMCYLQQGAQVPSTSSAVAATRKWEHRGQSAGARREGRGVRALWCEVRITHQRGFVQAGAGAGAEGRKGILGWTSGGGQGGSKVMGRMARCRAVPREPAPAPASTKNHFRDPNAR